MASCCRLFCYGHLFVATRIILFTPIWVVLWYQGKYPWSGYKTSTIDPTKSVGVHYECGTYPLESKNRVERLLFFHTITATNLEHA